MTVATSGQPGPRVHRKHRVRAHPRAQCATRAGGGVGQPDGMIAELIHDRNVEREDALRAHANAEAAALAAVDGDVQRLERPECAYTQPGWLDGDRHRLPPIKR